MPAEVVTLGGERVSVSDEAIEALDSALQGSAFIAGDAEEAAVRLPFNAMYDEGPAVTASCVSAEDVATAVRFAAEHELLLAIRGGGHSVAGLSVAPGAMLLSLAQMNQVSVDPEARRVSAGGGALWGEVDAATQAHGLVAPGGVVSDTGIAGLTLGGGYGWVRRKLGLSVDSLVEAEVVCADGEIRRASESENPDLFWALRGGGGNFGVVTEFTFELHPLGPDVAFSAVFYPIEEYAQVLRGFRDFMASAPNEITAVCVGITFPANPEMPEAVHDRPVVIVGAVHTGEDIEAGLEATKPLRQLGTLLFDMSGPTPFVGVQTGFDPLFPRNELRSYWKSQYAAELSDDAIDYVAEQAQKRPSPLTLVNMFAMGGAIADVDPEATAFSEREWAFMLSVDGLWPDASQDDEVIGFVRETWDGFQRFGTGSVYLNFTGLADEAPSAGVDSALGRNLARLAEIKAKYDPDNLFRVNNNIAPAGVAAAPAAEPDPA